MTALTVTGCILLLFTVLLFSPVILRFSYKDGKTSAKVQYLFFIIDFSPEKLASRTEKKAKKTVKEEYKKQKAEEETPQKKTKAASDTVKTVLSLIKASKKALDTIRNHLVFYKIKSVVIVGGRDAAVIAQNYAKYCTIAANGLSVLDSIFVVKEPDIYIQPDFLREKTFLELAFKMRISPWFPLSAAIGLLFEFLKVTRKNKQKREKIKGGKNNERNERHKQREHAASYQ